MNGEKMRREEKVGGMAKERKEGRSGERLYNIIGPLLYNDLI